MKVLLDRFRMCSLVGRFQFSDSLVLSTSFEDQLLIAQLFFALFYFKFKLFSPATDRGSNLYHGKVVDEGHSAAGLDGEMSSIVIEELEPAIEDVALTIVWK